MVESTEIQAAFKETEVGMIPSDWESKPLKTLVRITSGFSFSSNYFSKNGPVLLTPGNFKLQGGLYFTEKNTKHFSGEYDSAVQLAFGDLLIVMTDLTPECNILGKPAFIEIDEIILHNQRIGKIVPLVNTLSKEYLYWVFLSKHYLGRIKETATGSTVRHTSNKSIYSTAIPLPPTLAEQTAIATALNDADALITQLEKLIAKKRAIKQGTMQELLKPKEGWEVKRLGEVLKVRHGKSQKEVVDDKGEYPILASGGEIGRANSFLYNKPSVLIGRKGTIDEPQYMNVPFWSVDTLFYTEIGDNYDAKFIFYVFNLIDWYAYNEASGVPSLNARTIELIEKYLPETKSEQTQIAQILSDMDTEIALLEKKLAKYQLVKQGMMQNLLTGKIRLV